MDEERWHNLEIWRLADEMAFQVYRFTQHFPKEEIFGITSQIRRAALSVPTNIVEGFHRQLRKVTKAKSIFPNDKSLMKMIYLATMDATKKWTMVKQGWAEIIGQLAIHFEGRVTLEILD